MDLLEAIRRDRATRAFTDEPVSEATIEALVDAARRAGSGKNRQPWSFVAVRDPERRATLAEAGTYTSPLREAPVGIVVLVADRDDGGYTELDVFDCGRAFQNLKLAATAMGLGAVPQFIDPERAGEVLDAPEDQHVVLALALGHPAEAEPSIEGRPPEEVLERSGRRPLEAVLRWETVGGARPDGEPTPGSG